MKQENLGSDFDGFLKQDGLLAECEAGALKRVVAWQMKWKPVEVVAISPESRAATALRGQRKELPPNGFRKPAHRFIGIDSAISIHEPPVVY